MTDAEIINDIKTKTTVPVWPHWGRVNGCSKGTAYQRAQQGGAEFIRHGRIVRAVTSVMRRKLGIEGGQS
jgi:hypothetical protein